ATFEAQLDWIGRHYEFVSLDDLGQVLEGERKYAKPVAAVTFDDGYGDTYYHAFPILKRKGIPLAVFVVTDLVGSTTLQIHDELHLLLTTALEQWQAPMKEILDLTRGLDMPANVRIQLCDQIEEPFRFTRLCLELLPQAQIDQLIDHLRQRVDISANSLHEFHSLSWEMLNHMVKLGATVGSHTRSHTMLVNESWDTMLDEIKSSRTELETRLGRKIKHFAYPDGSFNADALNAVAVSGYRYAYTTCMHRDPRQPMLTIPRRVLWEKSCVDSFGKFSPSILSCQINGIFDPATRCQQAHWGTPA
ncbi:MAG: polysaccharide deacetylase family protein, partial [Pseudomonadota bacterium]